jgi:hypothetical protein
MRVATLNVPHQKAAPSKIMRSHRHRRKDYRLRVSLEQLVNETRHLSERGLRFAVDEIELIGRPLQRVTVWASLHFLPLGSPYCCSEPWCHVGFEQDQLMQSLREQLCARQTFGLEFRAVRPVVHSGVMFDDPLTGKSAAIDYYDIDRRDALGRTALIRAAERGHDYLVEELLDAGANPLIPDAQGRTALECALALGFWTKQILKLAATEHQREA